ncbi:MAG: hypothetical protein LBL62_06710 [Planctomycetaceae bacterium]|nr:hypothetical protein [Planctomycetaceae bacterium]
MLRFLEVTITNPIILRELYAKAVLKFAKLNTVAQQREAVTQGRSLLPYRLRYKIDIFDNSRDFYYYVKTI